MTTGGLASSGEGLGQDGGSGQERALRDGLQPEPYGLIGILATAVMLFATFTASFLVRRTGEDWVALSAPTLLWAGSAVLVLSSVPMELARRSGRRKWIGVTVVLGLVFVGLQLGAWGQLSAQGVFLSSHPASSFFYVLTGIHGLHVVGGLLALGYVLLRRRHLTECAVFWHFLTGIWLYLLVLMFQLG